MNELIRSRMRSNSIFGMMTSYKPQYDVIGSSSSVNLICFGPNVREASPHKRTHIDAIFLGRHQRQRNDPYRGKRKSSLWKPKKMKDDSRQRTQTQLPNGKTYALSPPTEYRRGPSKNWFEKLQLLLYNAHSSLSNWKYEFVNKKLKMHPTGVPTLKKKKKSTLCAPP